MKKLLVYFTNGLSTGFDPMKTILLTDRDVSENDPVEELTEQGMSAVNWSNVNYIRVSDE